MKYFFVACFLITYLAALIFYYDGLPGFAAFMMLALIAFIKIVEFSNGGDNDG